MSAWWGIGPRESPFNDPPTCPVCDSQSVRFNDEVLICLDCQGEDE